MKKPYAQPTGHVCGVCGIDWKKHEKALKAGQKVPTLETCVEVLREELRQARSVTSLSYSASGTQILPTYWKNL